MSNKGKLIFCIIGIALISLVTPAIVSFFMTSEGGVMLTTDYYIKYILNVFSIQIGLLYLAVLFILLFVCGDKSE